MSRVTLRIAMIRSPILITTDGCGPNEYQANANGYKPFKCQADSIGEAVNTVIMSVGQFAPTEDKKVKSAVRSEQAKKRWADLKAHQTATQPKQTPVAKPAPATKIA